MPKSSSDLLDAQRLMTQAIYRFSSRDVAIAYLKALGRHDICLIHKGGETFAMTWAFEAYDIAERIVFSEIKKIMADIAADAQTFERGYIAAMVQVSGQTG